MTCSRCSGRGFVRASMVPWFGVHAPEPDIDHPKQAGLAWWKPCHCNEDEHPEMLFCGHRYVYYKHEWFLKSHFESVEMVNDRRRERLRELRRLFFMPRPKCPDWVAEVNKLSSELRQIAARRNDA